MTVAARIAERRLRARRGTVDEVVEEDRAIVDEHGLKGFVSCAWPLVETAPLRWSWHHDALVEHAEAVQRRWIRNLVVCLPPGHTKSLIYNVLWPANSWIKEPTHRWLCAAYDPALSHRDARKHKLLIKSEWWLRRWGDVRIPDGQSAIGFFANTRGGWRMSTTPGGGATGHHPHTQLVDDSIKPTAARELAGGGEAAQLKFVSDWWTQTMPTRGDPATLARVIIQQRIHENDLPGEAIESGDYEMLVLPMHFDPEQRARTFVDLGAGKEIFFEDPRTVEGERIWPERNTDEVVAKLRKEMPPATWEAQMEQRPSPAGGAIFDEMWLKSEYDSLPARCTCLISIDARFKDAHDSGDYVAAGVWYSTGLDFYRHDHRHGRWSFTETIDVLEELFKLYPHAITKLIENKANGPAIENTLKQKFPGIMLVEPKGGKVVRAHAVTPLFKNGNVHLRRNAWWLSTYREQMKKFPRVRHDDLVDETTQALTHLSGGGANSMIAAMTQREQEQRR